MWRVAILLSFLVAPGLAMPPSTEYVLTKGMVITATNPQGTVTITGGEEVCPLHLPGSPQVPGGRRPFLVAQTGNVKAAAEAVGQG